eukprot:763392-Hanusia_phi.AAC.10
MLKHAMTCLTGLSSSRHVSCDPRKGTGACPRSEIASSHQVRILLIASFSPPSPPSSAPPSSLSTSLPPLVHMLILSFDQFSVTSISNFLWGMTSLSETLPPGQLEMFLGKTDGSDSSTCCFDFTVTSHLFLLLHLYAPLLLLFLQSSLPHLFHTTPFLLSPLPFLSLHLLVLESIVRDIKHLTPDFQEMDLSLLHIVSESDGC